MNDEEVRSSHVVLATSLAPAQQLIGNAFEGEQWFEPMLELPSMPAVTLQIELDEPAMNVDRTTFGPSTAMACFSEQSRTTFKHVPGRLSIILSPPETFLEMEPEQILDSACADAERLGRYITDHVTDYRVISHPADFYSLAPGSQELRPTQQTSVGGLTLAGDYTRQPFLATMEGAVISGQQAAEAVMQE